MNFAIFKGSLDTSRTTIAIQLVLLGMSGLLNVLLGWTVISLAGSGRTIVLPPSIEKSFWVEKDKVSATYLEQMAGYITYLALQSSPATVDYQNKQLLEYVAPASYGQIKQDMEYFSGRVKKGSISQVFVPKAYETNAPKKSVLVQGNMTTYVNEKPVGQKDVSVALTFEVVHGKLYVKSLKETESAQPASSESARVAADSRSARPAAPDAPN
jgi:conjugal transfer pilus assembly protein TraE